jgi:hypothetical protein
VDLEQPISHPTRVLLQYRPAHQAYYRPVIALTLAALMGIAFIQRTRQASHTLDEGACQ